MTLAADAGPRLGKAGGNDALDIAVRLFGWFNLAILTTFLIQAWLLYGLGAAAPGLALSGQAANPFESFETRTAWALLLAYPAALILAGWWVIATPLRGLREDSDMICAVNAYLVRGAFFAVLFIGLTDAAISFLRVEGLIGDVFGKELAVELGRAQFRGAWLHVPLIALAYLLALFSRSLGFIWLALMIVAAELLIVLTRFIFSYEQAFMGDLVRFWYAALFLFASAYTLLHEGHVRVDVFYSGFGRRARGRVNAVGSVALGMTLCWTILIIAMGGKSAIVTGAMANWEVSQLGFGMYIKYLMAGFLALFAITMLVQFTAYLFDAVADWRGEPGGREQDAVHAS